MKPYYEDDSVTLHHGDCLDVLRDLPDASVHAVVTDPPYNLSFMAKPWDAYEGHEDSGFAYWLSGLIDGEGHFAIKQHTRGTHAPFFQLKMRADERGTLERIRRSLGVGTITDEPREPNPMVKYVIGDKAGCQRLVDLLDKYPLRAKKQIDYWTWREAVCEWTSRPRGNRWHGQADNTQMASLRGRIMENRAYAEIPWSGHEFQDWCRLWATECLRVLKPGGHMVAFGGSRTWHRLAVAVEDAGFEIRDSIAWLYGSGFPKSLDVSKAIDKAAGAEQEVTRHALVADDTRPIHVDFDPRASQDRERRDFPATPDAQRWQGWGTALKPAFEPIVVGRKPLTGTVAANVLEHGTGALNVDGCRVAGEPWKAVAPNKGGRTSGIMGEPGQHPGGEPHSAGRWPPNVILDDSQSTKLDAESGTSTSTASLRKKAGTSAGNGETLNRYAINDENFGGFNDSGGASRFFPTFHYEPKAPQHERPRDGETAHPTVKPLDLMRWLVRLVTPPCGTVLEPFAGSGTTAEACVVEGFKCIAIEREASYLPLIVARLTKPIQVGLDFGEPA